MQHRKQFSRLEEPGHARFLTFSCRHRLPLFGNDSIKTAFADHLLRTREAHRFELYAWVVMPEHVHLLVMPTANGDPLSKVLRTVKGAFAAKVLQRWRRLCAPVLVRVSDSAGAHFWQPGGGYDRNIISDEEFREKLAYIHANPVNRGLAAQEIDWLWSSARWYAGLDDRYVMDPLPM